MTVPHVITYPEVVVAARLCAERNRDTLATAVYGVPRGGYTPAALVAGFLGLPVAPILPATTRTLVVDDLADSGATLRAHTLLGVTTDALFAKVPDPETPHPDAPHAVPLPSDRWVVFPWEEQDPALHAPTDAVRRLIQHMGEDPDRDGLVDTPARVVKAYTELTEGYHQDPAAVLSTTFADPDMVYDEVVMVSDVPFASLCEHHLLPFTGTATIAYIPHQPPTVHNPGCATVRTPNTFTTWNPPAVHTPLPACDCNPTQPEPPRVVGLSKLPRLLHLYARRLQVQERLTVQVTTAMDTHLTTAGSACILRAHHSCMSCRGVRSPGTMTTSSLTGRFRDNPAARAELLALER